MNEASVGAINFPRARGKSVVNSLARQTLWEVFTRLQVGTLTLQDGEEITTFGSATGPGHPHASIRVHNPALYSAVLNGGSIGAGESFMLGHWSSPELVEVIRLFTANMAVLQSMDGGLPLFKLLALKLVHLFNRNTETGSRRNISAHYDLGNDFFELFLDPSLMYSAAIFPDSAATLEVASEHKLETVCQQLELQPGDHLLEIGTGWGGMAVYAATHFGCRVTTTTLSSEQYDYTRARVIAAGLEQQITVLCKDYRDLEGSYDKLVSIEMIEAVGHEFYQAYFEKCSALLKPEGLMLIQAITMADQRFESAKRSVDFIQRYIFPGGCLPSMEVISRHIARDTDMQIVHMLDITDHYARTLACWRERFQHRLDEVTAQGFDEKFQRMWEYYLCYCEGGFLERVIGTVQLTFAKPGYRFKRPASAPLSH